MTIAEGDPRPAKTEERWFGLLLLAAFSALGVLLGWRFGSLRLTQVMMGSGLALAFLYYTAPPLRVPFYRTWMALTMPLGRAISTLILATIYFLLITPMACLMRALGRDPLQRQFDSSAETYWTPYSPGEDEDRYFRQS